MAYNKTTKVGKKKIVKQKDVTDWIVAVGKHQGLISGKDWVMAQDILSQNENKMYRKPLKNTSFLAGILRCSDCGSLMRPKLKTSTTSDGELRFDYICDLKMRSKGEKCKCRNTNGNETDKLVLEGIKSLAKPTSAFYKELLQISKQKVSQDKATDEINTLELTYTKNDTTIKNLSERMAYIDIDLLKGVQDDIRDLRQKNEEIRNRIKELTKGAPSIINDKETAELIINILDNYVSKFDELDTITQRNVLKIFIASLETDGEKVIMNLVGTRNHTQIDQNVLLSVESK
jgi:site-specific DNA recombinase